MTFFIMRHGESIWNKENKFTGWTDVELSEKGEKEAIIAGEKLQKIKFDNIICSDLHLCTFKTPIFYNIY